MKALRAIRRGVAGAAIGMVALVGLAGGLSGQEGSAAGVGCASPELPLGHWGETVVRRWKALGAMPLITAARPLSACTLAAQAAIESMSSDTTPAASWKATFGDEYRPSSGFGVEQAKLAVRLGTAEGAVLPGRGEFPPERSGATPIAVGTELSLSAGASIRLGSRAWVTGQGVIGPDTSRVQRLEADFTVGPLMVTIGRGQVAFGETRSGAVVLTGLTGLDRIKISTLPFRLPLFLEGIGPVSISTFTGQMNAERHPARPYIWGARGSINPHPRIYFAVNRAALFGGEGKQVTPAALVDLLIGRVAGIGFENQIVSVEAAWRLPTEGVLPITAYVDWGAEDAAGAWWDVPGRVVGVYLPTLAGLGLTVEHARFAESCCFNPEWYRHWSFPGNWVGVDQPLGHPLGGHGSETLLALDWEPIGGRASLKFTGYWRDRGSENLYSPGRDGRSRGAQLDTRWRLRSKLELQATGDLEAGSDWNEYRVDFQLGRFF